MIKFPLFIFAMLITHIGVTQDRLELDVSSSTLATLTVNGKGVKKNESANIDVPNKAALLSIKGKGLSDKIIIKIARETGLHCDNINAFPPLDNRQFGISKAGILRSESSSDANVIGATINLVVLVNNGRESLTPIASWNINTGLKKLEACPPVSIPLKRDDESFVQATGVGYYDALTLQRLQNKDSVEHSAILRILGYYAGENLSAGDLDRVFKGNSFIMEYVNSRFPIKDKGVRESTGGMDVSKKFSSLASSALSSVGGLDVTNLADGFAKFLVKRTKQELNITFFTKFKEEISKPEFRDLQTVFPQTYRALQAIGDDIYNYQAYLQTLRESFEKDLANILSNLPTVIDNHPVFFETQPELEAILRTGFYIALSLQDKQHPGMIIANYPESYLDHVNSNFKAGIQTLKIFSNSLRHNDPDATSPESKHYWLTEKEIAILIKNREAFKLYLGLIEAEAKKTDVNFIKPDKSEVSLESLLESSFIPITTDLPLYERYLKNLTAKMQTVEKKIEGLKGARKDSLLLENYYSFFSSTLDLLKFTTEVEELPHFKDRFPDSDLKVEVTPYLSAAQISADVVIDVNRRNYGSAVTNAYSLWNLIFKGNQEEKLKLLNTALDDVKTKYSAQLGEYDNEKKAFDKLKKKDARRGKLALDLKACDKQLKPVRSVEQDIKTLEAGDEIMALFFKYGTFMATIVQAQSSDEVEQAIEAFALPPGSSRIKRESSFNVSINAYMGVFTGYEHVKDIDTKVKFNSYGLTAPIGCAVSWGYRHHSFSLFVSVIDLGAIAAYRFSSDSKVDTLKAQQVPTINLKDIFSPGIFFSYGIPKTPVSINMGYQVGPNLRHIENKSNGTVVNSYENSTYSRASISILVDIPIINLYTKTAHRTHR